jgi:hypothetical protein
MMWFGAGVFGRQYLRMPAINALGVTNWSFANLHYTLTLNEIYPYFIREPLDFPFCIAQNLAIKSAFYGLF